MGKKKSKTQKYKRNVRKKIKKQQNNIEEIETKNKQLVNQNNVIYNIAITNPNLLKKKKNNKIKPIYHNIKNNINPTLIKLKDKFKSILTFIEEHIPERKVTVSIIKKKIIKKKPNKTNIEKIVLPKLATDKKIPFKNETLNKLFYLLKSNLHIIFNTCLILCLCILILGLMRVNAFSKGTIIYISILVLFLNIVAISHNKYLSGKIFSIILCIGMTAAIWQLQYTYDFIRNLNFYKYEYKTYYVVTFNTNINKSIYNINNKKVGLLSNNSTNIERFLNTKLDKVEYIEYNDSNSLFESFYNQKFRAAIVNDNEYKYLLNNESNGGKSVKILYEFKVNTLK